MSKSLFDQNEELKKENKRLAQFEDLYKDMRNKVKSLEEKLESQKSDNQKLHDEFAQERNTQQSLYMSLQQANQVLSVQVKNLQDQKDGKVFVK